MSLVFRRVSRTPDWAGSALRTAAIAFVSMTACAAAHAQSSTEVLAPATGFADEGSGPGQCAGLPTHAALKGALTAARDQSNGGLNLDMWASVVNRDGVVCAVAFTGADRGSQWPGSRVISAQKANTANAFSLPHLSLATANLFSAVQPGGSLFGLQHSNPVDTGVAYRGPATSFGAPNDPMVGHRVGGVNVFGGGLALYNAAHALIGAIGVSGDTSCADHNIAWRTRTSLGLDHVPTGVSGDPSRPDNIVYDITPQAGQQEGVSVGGFGHPVCSAAAKTIAGSLSPTQP